MDNNIAGLKIVALGATGTGKTSYLTGIFHQFFWNQYRSRNAERYPDDELVVSIDSNFMRSAGASGGVAGSNFINNLKNFNELRNIVNTGVSTQFDSEYKFDLSMCDNQNEIHIPMEIYDYVGGIADISGIGAHSQEVSKLISKLKNSDIIYVLLDTSIAKQYDGSTDKKKLIEEKLQTRFFSELIRGLIEENKYSAKYIQFVFTKWDAASKEEQEKAKQCLRDVYGTVIRACQRQGEQYTWKYDIKCVTLFGHTEKPEELKKDGKDGKEGNLIIYEYRLPKEMNPDGLDDSFITSIRNALDLRCGGKNNHRQNIERQIRRYYELMKCYRLGMKEKRKLHEAIVSLQKKKDGLVSEHFRCNQACEMLVNHTNF